MDIKIFLMDKGLLANSYQTFVMIFRFCLLSKPPTLLLTNNTTSRWIEYQQKSNEECMPFLLCDIPEKQTNRVGRGRGVEDILFWTLLPPLNFSFFNFIPGNSRQICLLSNPYKIPRPKTKTPLEIPHYFFFTLGNSTSFLDNPWKFNMLFLWYPWPWKFHILNSLLFFFFWNSPLYFKF